jgi:uncharacterized protein involved in exopolysaccharide biosynthesis
MATLNANLESLLPPSSLAPETVSTRQLIRATRRRWKWLLSVLIISAGMGLAASMLLGKRYQAEVVAMPRSNYGQSGLLNSLGGQLGGLAQLAGLGMGAGGERAEAVATLRSHLLARQMIEQDQLLPVLFSSDWDAATHGWTGRPRTLNDGVRLFDHRLLSVIEDHRNGLVTVRIEWKNPQQAAVWANEFVARANARLREQAIARADASIRFLKQQVDQVQTVEIRDALYLLMQAQYKNLLLAKTTPQYAFIVIDPAVASDPDQYVFPSHALFALGGLFFGLVIAILILLADAARDVGRD